MNTSIILKSFKREKIVTIEQLTKWLSCSIPKARRRLKQTGHAIDVQAIRTLLAHHDLLKKQRIFNHPTVEQPFAKGTQPAVTSRAVARETLDTL